jgi:hypothetical protein
MRDEQEGKQKARNEKRKGRRREEGKKGRSVGTTNSNVPTLVNNQTPERQRIVFNDV